MQTLPNKIFLLSAVFAITLLGQEAPVTAKRTSAGQVMGQRDKEKEDQIAKLFEGIRADAKIPPLKRIRHRDDLEQQVCTSALTGKSQSPAFYVTAIPEAITPELKKIASFNRVGPRNTPWSTRYSVAVWRVREPQTGGVLYWVGVRSYGTAVGEFVDCHFTDDVFYCGKWKESVARPCRGK
jgi:hypothetical protein